MKLKTSLAILSLSCFAMGADAETTMGMDSQGNIWQSTRQGNVTQGMDSRGRQWTEIHTGPSSQGMDNKGRSWSQHTQGGHRNPKKYRP